MNRAGFVFAVVSLTLSLLTPALPEVTTIDPESLGFSATRLARIGAWYQACVDAGEVSGAVVAVARSNHLAYLQAVGFQDRAKTVPMRPDSIFWIASMTKPITSVAAMILVEDGRLDLDAAVARYLPELKNMQVGIEETDPATGQIGIKRVAAFRPMTVRDLLRHTSGLVYPPQFIDSPIHRLYGQARFAGDNTLAEFVASLADLPLAHQPGTAWEYSWGLDVLARVIEVASNEPFDQFLEKRIFAPLHMVDTGFYVAEAKLDRLVEAPEARYSAFDLTKPRKMLSGGGGLASTATDYLRFSQMLLNGGELDGVRILTSKTVQEMTSNSLPPDIEFAGDMVGPGAGSSWGLGFAIRTNPTSSQIPGSVGSYTWGGVWGTYFWIDPAEKLIALQMIQVEPGKPKPDFRGAIRNLTYGALRVAAPSPSASPIMVPTKVLDDYTGRYDFGASSSARDRLDSPLSTFVGVGLDIETTAEGVSVVAVREGEPASMAGIKAGDLITAVDDVPVTGIAIAQVIGKLQGAINSQVQLKVSRAGVGRPVEYAVTRATIHRPPVALRVRADSGKLLIDAIGTWPILDFEKGTPLALIAMAPDDFRAEDADHTRVVFIRDAKGDVSAAILNPGHLQQRGERY